MVGRYSKFHSAMKEAMRRGDKYVRTKIWLLTHTVTTYFGFINECMQVRMVIAMSIDDLSDIL